MTVHLGRQNCGAVAAKLGVTHRDPNRRVVGGKNPLVFTETESQRDAMDLSVVLLQVEGVEIEQGIALVTRLTIFTKRERDSERPLTLISGPASPVLRQ